MSALHGLKILNTRAAAQASGLSKALESRGALPVEFPCIEILPPLDPAPLEAALERLRVGDYSRVVFSSANAVEAVVGRVDLAKIPARTKLAAIGNATAAIVAQSAGGRAIQVPGRHTAADLIAVLEVLPGDPVFVPSSAVARDELASRLAALGALVDAPIAYRTVTGSGGANLGPMLAAGLIDAIAFASPSAVDGFLERLAEVGSSIDSVNRTPVACIGPTTALRARARGFQKVHEATRQTVDGLVDALQAVFASHRKGVVRCP